jgi:hypothetical protein
VRVLAVIVLAPAFALGAVAGAVGIVGEPVKQTQRPDSLVWAERVFPSRHSFETWLQARGASYATWAQRHSSAAVIFDGNDERQLAEASPAPTKSTKGHSLLVALVAGASLVLLFALNGLRSRRPRLTPRRAPRRAAKTLVLPRPRLRVLAKGASAWPSLATSAAAAMRLPSSFAATLHDGLTARRSRQVLPTLAPRTPGASAWPSFATSAAAAVRRQSALLATVHDGLTARRIRHLLPTIAFYAISVVLAVVIGASVAIYLQ